MCLSVPRYLEEITVGWGQVEEGLQALGEILPVFIAVAAAACLFLSQM